MPRRALTSTTLGNNRLPRCPGDKVTKRFKRPTSEQLPKVVWSHGSIRPGLLDPHITIVSWALGTRLRANAQSGLSPGVEFVSLSHKSPPVHPEPELRSPGKSSPRRPFRAAECRKCGHPGGGHVRVGTAGVATIGKVLQPARVI